MEELYISFNELDELFDISFLEHLRVLDCEGNNVQAVEQLMYLRRCNELVDVNFKHNPVSSGQNAGLYYEKVLESVPNLTVLDDEVVPADKVGFLEHKQHACKKAWQQQLAAQTNVLSTSADPVLSKFLKLGLRKETVRQV